MCARARIASQSCVCMCVVSPRFPKCLAFSLRCSGRFGTLFRAAVGTAPVRTLLCIDHGSCRRAQRWCTSLTTSLVCLLAIRQGFLFYFCYFLGVVYAAVLLLSFAATSHVLFTIMAAGDVGCSPPICPAHKVPLPGAVLSSEHTPRGSLDTGDTAYSFCCCIPLV